MSGSQADYAPPLPAAVRRIVEETNKRITDLNGASDPTVVDGADPQPAAADPAPAAPVAGSVPTPAAPVEDDWRQKYLTLQGKYDAEVPTLRQQVAQLRELVMTQPAREPAAAPVPHTPTTPDVEVPAAELEAYGEDLVSAARRWARSEMASDMRRLEQQIAELKGTTIKIAETADKDMSMRYLDAHPIHGPTWRAVNNQPAFRSWLEQADPMSGVRRFDLISAAFTQGDGPRTAAFFDAFAREHTTTSPVPVPAPHTPPAPAGGAGQVSLAELAAPGQGAVPPGNPGAQPQKRIWTQPEIAAFYRKVQQGLYAGQEVEKDRIERDILSAPGEGRIRT